MKSCFSFLVFSFFITSISFAGDHPTPADASSDNSKSVLASKESTANVVAPQLCCNADSCSKKVVYRNKRNIAPCAVPQTVNISFCEIELDACCKKSSHLESTDVAVCVPPCSCTQKVSTSREGRRVVYDYGRYEVVLNARRNGTIEVDYKKRLFDR
jgi:hypothetical protein